MLAVIGAGAALLIIPLIILALLVVVPLVLFLIVFWIWMLVSAIQNKGLTDGEKTGWVLAIVFFHFLGSFLYFFIGRLKRKTPLIPI
jgi:sterol desaturase/sphingolipid hydroxylase (fatty acid hydroxylase superfamily)